MSVEVLLRPEAEHDIEDAAQWYETQYLGLGHNFLDEVSSALKRVEESPTLFPEVHRTIRRALMQKFPFGIYFQLNAGKAVVIAVFHASRNPERWKLRSTR